ERGIIEGGTVLIQRWLELGPEEQERRFQQRIDEPVGRWKLRSWTCRRGPSGMNTRRPATECSRRARRSIPPHEKLPREKIKLEKKSKKGAYDDRASIKSRRFNPEKY